MTEAQQKKMQGIMGLCLRARQATFGEDGCMKAIKNGTCGVLLLDESASPATQEKYKGTCQRNNVPCVVLPKDLLYAATGKPGMAMAVNQGGFAHQITNLLHAPEA